MGSRPIPVLTSPYEQIGKACGLRHRGKLWYVPSSSLGRGTNLKDGNFKDSQTDTYCKKKKKKEEKNDKEFSFTKVKYCECGKKIKNKSKTCNECHTKTLRKVDRPDIDLLKKDIENLGYKGTGRKYGVSDNAIRKWLK